VRHTRAAAFGADAVSRVNVAVAVTDDALGNLFEVAAACRALGFEHTATFVVVGVLLGSVRFERLAALRAIPGVETVEVARQWPAWVTAKAGCRRLLN
jgi:hypothetical protein